MVVVAAMPGCILRVNIFVVNADSEANLQTVALNALYVALAKLGIPMKHCIYATTTSTT